MAALDLADITHPLTRQVVASNYPSLADWQPPTPMANQGPATTVPVTPTTMATTQQPTTPTAPAPTQQAPAQQGYTSLSQIPNVKMGSYTGTVPANKIFGIIPTNLSSDKWVDAKGYIDARMARLSSVAKMSGMPLEQRRALREQVKYELSKPMLDKNGKEIKDPTKTGNDNPEMLAKIAAIFDAQEDPLAQQVLAAQSGQEQAATDPWANPSTPLQIQAAIANFMAPFASRAATSSTNNANYLRELAGKESSPALAAILNQQASDMQALGDQAALSYMNAGAYAPAMAAMQHEAALQNQIAALQAQVQNQSSGGDLASLLGQLPQG